MVTFSQEMLSIGVMVFLCILSSIACVIIWMLRWRRNQLRNKAGQADHQCEDEPYAEKPANRSFSKRAVSDTVSPPKRAESVERERSHRSISNGASTSALQQPKQDDVMVQSEPKGAPVYVSKHLERIKEESKTAKNKGLDTVSVMSAVETLQRNDSKVNVFPADKMEEIDLNPGLNNVINLETI